MKSEVGDLGHLAPWSADLRSGSWRWRRRCLSWRDYVRHHRLGPSLSFWLTAKSLQSCLLVDSNKYFPACRQGAAG